MKQEVVKVIVIVIIIVIVIVDQSTVGCIVWGDLKISIAGICSIRMTAFPRPTLLIFEFARWRMFALLMSSWFTTKIPA